MDKLPKYENPPLSEVVFGVTFDPISKLKLGHIGLFWNEVIEEFPKFEQAPVIGPINDLIEKETKVPIPRSWMINSDEDELIQIQKNKFLFNWRKKESSYPNYENISTMFFNSFDKYKDFVITRDLGTFSCNQYELSYINHILLGDGWDDIRNINELFPKLSFNFSETTYLKLPHNFVWQSAFDLPDGSAIIVVKIQSGFRILDKFPIIILEISIKNNDNIKDIKDIELNEWFKKSHEAIVLTFEEITSNEVQNVNWKKIGNVNE